MGHRTPCVITMGIAFKVIALMVVALLGVAPAFAADPIWSVSTSFNFSRGDYGTNENTDLVYIPFTLGVTPIDRLTLSLTVPYIYQSTQTISTTGGGVAVRKDKLRSASAQKNVTESAQGLGDILVKASYIFVDEREVLPEIAGFVKIKVPTADEDKALGTGKFDETFGVDFAKTFLERWTGFLTLAYTFIGSPAGADLDNSFAWSLGAAYRVSSPVSVFAFVDGATAVSPGQDNPLEVRVGAEYKLTKALRFTGTIGTGLTDGAPDFSFSAGLAYRF